MELDDILSEKDPVPPPAEAPPVETEPPKPELGARKAFQEKEQAAQEAGRARAPDGKFVAAEPEAKPEVKPEVKPEPSQELTPKEHALLRAAQDERTKRQDLERRLVALEAQQKPAEPPKTFYEDPDGVLAQTHQTIAQERQQMQHAFLQNRVQVAEMIARKQHSDFDQYVPLFGELLQANPGLYQQWISSPDPAEFAYTTAKNTAQLRQAGSLDAIKQQAEKEVRIKLEAEFKAREAALLKAREDIPDSLTNTRGASQPRVAWGGPPSLDDILK